jgi:ABC-type glycerol-3-phosphate transport system permease component
MSISERRGKQIKIIILVIVGFLNFFPIYWLIISPLRPPEKLLVTSISEFLIPSKITFAAFLNVLNNVKFRRFLLNSLIVATLATLLSIGISVLGAYSLARLNFYGKKILGRLILFTYVVAPVLLIVPMFIMFVAFHLNGTYWGLILAHTVLGVPFSIWLLRGFFMSLPAGIEEAARIDGTSRLGALIRVTLPLAMPGIVVAATYVFILSWNDYLFALVFISRDYMKTLPYGVASLYMNPDMGAAGWCNLLAASLFACIPIFVLFMLIQKKLIQGMAGGAIKG